MLGLVISFVVGSLIGISLMALVNARRNTYLEGIIWKVKMALIRKKKNVSVINEIEEIFFKGEDNNE